MGEGHHPPHRPVAVRHSQQQAARPLPRRRRDVHLPRRGVLAVARLQAFDRGPHRPGARVMTVVDSSSAYFAWRYYHPYLVEDPSAVWAAAWNAGGRAALYSSARLVQLVPLLQDLLEAF